MTIANTTFLHFNDVYNVEQAAPFVASVKNTRKDLLGTMEKTRGQVITVFSGDAFSPSLMSVVLRGEQMVPVLNAIDIDVACLGNHDLDFGIEEFRALKDKCNFPWLCSNAQDAKLKEPLGGCHEYFVLDKRGEGGAKILFFGLVEADWFEIMPTLGHKDVLFEPPPEYVKRRIPELNAEHGPFDSIVALTHMRMPNDIALAHKAGSSAQGMDCGGIDLILGGHDHHYEDIIENGVRILNSGSDFKNYTIIDVEGRDGSLKCLKTTSVRVDVPSTSEILPDKDVVSAIQPYREIVDAKMNVVVGRTQVRLDARFAEIRRKETNIGNFLAELMTRATGADLALFNAGTIRADRFVEEGDVTMRDLCELLPESNDIMVIEVTAGRLLQALENGVSKYPAMEGRFPCVDGVRFVFDPIKPAGSRIVPGSVHIRDQPLMRKHDAISRSQRVRSVTNDWNDLKNFEEKKDDGRDDEVSMKYPKFNHEQSQRGYSPLDPTRTYSLASRPFCVAGKDGYTSLVGAPVLQESEKCPLLLSLMQDRFVELRSMESSKDLAMGGTFVKVESKPKVAAGEGAADVGGISPQLDGRILNVARA